MIALNIPQTIEMIEDHFNAEWGSGKVLTLGGVAGTSLFKHAIHACMKRIPFENILVIDGCRDYIGLMRTPAANYVYYQDLFVSSLVPHIDTIQNPMHYFYVKPKPGYVPVLDDSRFKYYNALIISNAHLIPQIYLNMICERFTGKILMLVDPYDVNGEKYWMNVPTLYDSLSKQSTLIALARSLFDIDTRAVDRKIKCDFRTIKMQRRAIGKLDANQYVTNNPEILDMIRNKQRAAEFRRNQKVIVRANHITRVKDSENEIVHSLGPNVMLQISQLSKPLLKSRIHASATEVYTNFTYTDDDSGIYVQPANIITLDEALHHRFNSVILVLGEEPGMTRKMWYSLMKIANIISIVYMK